MGAQIGAIWMFASQGPTQSVRGKVQAVGNVGNDGSNSGSHQKNDQDHHASAWSIQVLCDFCPAAVGAQFDLQNVTVLYL